MKKKVMAFAICATPFVFGAQFAFAEPPTLHLLADEPVSNDPAKHAVVATVDWPAGADTGRHTHPGDEYATVLEGTIEVTTDGKGAHVYKAGEAYHNARGAVHDTRNVGDGPAKTSAVFIVDKGVPTTTPVK